MLEKVFNEEMIDSTCTRVHSTCDVHAYVLFWKVYVSFINRVMIYSIIRKKLLGFLFVIRRVGMRIPRRHAVRRADRVAPQHGRAGEIVSRMHQVPEARNRCKASKHDRGIVHGVGLNGQSARHRKDDNGEEDPDGADAIDPDAHAAERVGRILDGDAALGEIDNDGHGIGRRETNGADASKGVERRRGAKVDAAEEGDDGGGENKGPDGHVETAIDAAPELVAGNGAVTRKGVGAARGGGQGADASKHEDAEDEEEQAEAATCGARGVLEDDADGLTTGVIVGFLQQGTNFGDDEEQGDEVEEAGYAGRGDGEDNGFRDLALGVLYFFAHGCDHAVAGEDVCG